MDKSHFIKQSLKEADDHQEYYNTLSSKEQTKVFFQLMSVAYGFVGKPFPRMEKKLTNVRRQYQ